LLQYDWQNSFVMQLAVVEVPENVLLCLLMLSAKHVPVAWEAEEVELGMEDVVELSVGT
jgi:hypothetical protein